MPPKKAANGEKKTKSSTSAGAGGRKKGPSPYNSKQNSLIFYAVGLVLIQLLQCAVYMKSKLAEFKEKYPDMTHKERFKKVAEEWKTSSENPANKADE
ncbi:hypothetical protein FRC05_005284 [Tulasnella sp. 425]|nr:hypothetical protein FRC05_005284 [Tulasnella sp. 425]